MHKLRAVVQFDRCQTAGKLFNACAVIKAKCRG